MSGNHELEIRNCKSKGFTIVELLVVITIIGILISLLLPAVQAAREAARRTQCANNLKQIGLATLNYENTWRILPAGAYVASPDWSDWTVYRGSILIRLLPYIEQQALYDQFDLTRQTGDQTLSGSATPIGTTIVAAYVCPSDSYPSIITDSNTGYPPAIINRAKHNYAASCGPTALGANSGCDCETYLTLNQTAASLGVSAPMYRPGTNAGVFGRNSVSNPLSSIRDGLSNTILFGEVLPACSATQRNGGWSASNNGQGLTSTLVPINYDTSDDSSPDYCHRSYNWNMELGFKSSHPGGAQFTFGDGSIHFLSENIDYGNYQYLGGKADGQSARIPD